jgi:hypothetical protein
MENQLYPVLEAIRKSKAELIGKGPWIKNAAYQVFKFEGKFYAIIVSDQMDMWLEDDTLTEIKEEEISKYV